MDIYKFLSAIKPARKSYAMKFFFVALPLVAIALAEPIVFYLMWMGRIALPLTATIATTLALVIASTFTMIYCYRRLMSPLRLGRKALQDYVQLRELPSLPAGLPDEAGRLLSDIQTTIEQLNRLIIEKSDMIDLLSHDLRSPVGRIQSICQLIKTDDSVDKAVYADYILNESKGLLRMLEDILLMLKEDSHAFTMANVNLKQLMLETISFFDFAIADKDLVLQIMIDDNLVIHVQPELFTQAVRNIIGNAIKFSMNGKTIAITGRQIVDQISISIRDEGLGFEQTDIQKIFDRFTSAGKKGTHGEASIGLGLYLSKKIIEKHEGKLLAESEGMNKGASFTIVLNKLVTKKPQEKKVTKPRAEPAPGESSKASPAEVAGSS